MAHEPSPAREIRLLGILKKEIFATADRGYVVADLVTSDLAHHVVAGDLADFHVGDAIELQGESVVHPRFGAQVRIFSARWVPPASPEGIRRLLSSGSIKGIGPQTARRIVGHFGSETLKVLNDEPARLSEVPGLPKSRARIINEAWQQRRAFNNERAFLAGLGLGPGMVERIRKTLGERASERLRADPWLLAREIEGIGFRRADEIAQRLEMKTDARERIEAGVEYTLQEQSEDGHVFTPRELLVGEAQKLLSLPAGPIEDALPGLLERGRLVVEEDAVYLPRLHAAEVEVASALAKRVGPVPAGEQIKAERALEWAQPKLGVALIDDQRRALAQMFNQRTAILTGGPGVGKTTIVRALVEVFAAKKLALALAAPTGRAARRLAEACGRPASTIHRLLEFNPKLGRFTRGRDLPLEVDVLVVDEASMIDLPLMMHLMRALPARARLYLVGDADQLPSVGPGDVLRSLVECGRIPVQRLTKILRQHEGSMIVRAAHAVLHGEIPEFPEDGDAYFVERDHPLGAQRAVLELVAERLPKRLGLDPLRGVQVLSPMNRGPLGVNELNEVLKQRLNPAAGRLFGAEERQERRGARGPFLDQGDRVIQTRNDYDLDVMNGEIGFVAGRDPKSGALDVEFDDRAVRYPPNAVGELAPAYAITVHKSQGCEFEAVVLLLSMQHFVMLRRNLLYTAITRAKRLLVIVGARRALRQAVEMGQVERRRSRLEERLRREIR